MRSKNSRSSSWPSEVSLPRIARQRSTSCRRSVRSSADGAALRQLAAELLRHERDGGERRAELVGGRGGEAVELRQVLLAGEHHLGRGERLRELARLLRHAPSVDPREGRRRAGSPSRPRSRTGTACSIVCPGIQGIGRCRSTSSGRRADGEQAEAERALRRQGGRRRSGPARGTASRTGSAARPSGGGAPRAAGCRRREGRSPRRR